MKKLLEGVYSRSFVAVCQNVALSFVMFFLARVLYYVANYSLFSSLGAGEVATIFRGGVLFDLAGLAYINILYILIMLLPLHLKERRGYQQFAKWSFLTLNYIAFLSNIADAMYYPFTKRRTTGTIFNEFAGDGGVFKVIFDEILSHWLLSLVAIGLCVALYFLYRAPRGEVKKVNFWAYYPLQLGFLLLSVVLSVFAMRGGIGADVRPITISNAMLYIDNPSHSALVLNTPFSFIRTLGKKSFVNPKYFESEEELAEIFTPIKCAPAQPMAKAQNVVVLIVESFSKEYIGALNGGKAGYAPFLDSLIEESLTFEYSYANGVKSIDAMPSVLSGIPMFVEPFFLTSSSVNKLSGVAGELATKGYHTSFFHGAQNSSMGFSAFANATGFESYYGRDNYNNDADFDGRWAIWDEEFLQYYASMLSSFEEPFMSALFTASSHHPFKVPERYAGVFDEGTIPIHKCVGYTDNALRRFFESVKDKPWFDSTLFVITADHTSLTAYPEEANSLSVFNIPIILYQHGSDLRGRSEVIAQQIDVMPTVLNYLGYDKPHLSFGKDLLSTSEEDSYAVNYYNGLYQYFKGDFMLLFDGKHTAGLYDFKHDKALNHNLLGKVDFLHKPMENELKAIIQQYMWRMEGDQLVINATND